ncbi:MAG TPA: MlaD family protein [Thermoguttaceae bacterium]|nr:MlaD family protein [Thermoguttaceae bacterium]
MNERSLQFLVGVTVFAAALIGGILVLWLGNDSAMFESTYPIKLEFTNALGVSANTPLRRSGILIGRVRTVDLDPLSGMVRVKAGIYEKEKLPANVQCEVRTGLLGDAEIEFYIPHGKKPSKEFLSAGATLRGSRMMDPMTSVANLEQNLSGAIQSVSQASDSLGQTLNKINTMLDENQQHINSIMERTDDTLAMVKDTASFTHELMSDPKFREDLKTEFQNLPQTLRGARDTVGQLKTTLQNMDHTMSLVDNNLENIKNFTEPLGDNGGEIAKNIDESVRRLNQVMMEVETFTKAINSRESTIGLLTQDDEIYQRLNRTIRNVEEVSYRLKPIVNDVRIVSDRLARHPGSILRDAVRPGPGTKGLPPDNFDPAACGVQPSGWSQ